MKKKSLKKKMPKYMEGETNKVVLEDVEKLVKSLGKSLNVLEGRNILVTGASGLIGSYFLDTVAYLNDYKFKRKAFVVGLQRGNAKKVKRLSHLIGRKDIKFVTHDARFAYKPSIKIDYIIHSAGMSAPASFQADPLGTVDVNVNGVRWVLEYAKKNRVKSVLYLSSGETYGLPTKKDLPIRETFNGNVSPLNTRACYAESKRLAETLCWIYATKYEVPVKIARAFATYGPGITLKDRRVVADFMRIASTGKPIQMLSEGKDTRNYTYITDAMFAYWKILLSDANGEAFNVANDKIQVSIKDLAKTVHEVYRIKEPVSVKTKQKADFIKDAPNHLKVDVTKIRKKLGFEPKVGIKEGVSRTVRWNKELRIYSDKE